MAYVGISSTLLAAQTIDSNSLQLQEPIGSTIVPVLGSSDQTYLTNYSVDKKAWPVFLSLDNVQSSERLKVSRNCSVLGTHLPVPPKHCFHGPRNLTELNAEQDNN